MEEMKEKLRAMKIVPVVKLDDTKDAVPLAKALVEGGLPCAEVTFRTEAAAESIKRMLEAFPDMLVGAGTVLTTEQVDAAIEAGAKFIVSPGLNPKTVRYCQEKNIPILPGVATASEIEQALELGLDTVKFFPAEVNGGLLAIKALSAPYHMMHFMPTGGVGPQNVKDYLAFDKVLACGGTWMVKDALINGGEFEKIKEMTKEAVDIVK
ncbi:keto-hydroxyglutarate-aldolase/keto-deoxy-phosphogluconate aldolase [Coprococcus comes]|uniref:2-dehydro-3-deoxy-phosphogluconate aldolase n=2 Tax=Coprococcus comes TaxID=410072 RepID=A0A3R6DYR9_9FIRM|nr:keto-hydroxyglutarate-aldolase/keto-deoxy-phosphogluconate aldolase [Coprococcus comes]